MPNLFSGPTTPSPWERFQSTRVFRSVDGLRALSIVAVILFHCDVPLPGFLGRRGFLGVSLFFVISGFLITTLLLREQRDRGMISLKKFYARRALRLFPLYYAVLLMFCVAVWVFDRQSEEGKAFWHHLVFYIFYMNNWVIGTEPGRVIFAASWSLATEEQFYLFWPSILALVRRPWIATMIILSVLAGSWILQLLVTNHTIDWGEVPNRALTSLSPAICMGCLLALALHYPRTYGWLYWLLGWQGAPVLAFAMLLLLSFCALSPTVMCLVMVALLASVVLRPDHSLGRLLENSVVRHVGMVSYGVYLLFTFVLNLGTRVLHLKHSWLRFAWTASVTFGVASLSYRYYEAPFLRLKSRFVVNDGRVNARPDA